MGCRADNIGSVICVPNERLASPQEDAMRAVLCPRPLAADRGGITTAIWQDWNGGVLGRRARIRQRSADRWRLSQVKREGRSRIEYWGVDAI